MDELINFYQFFPPAPLIIFTTPLVKHLELLSINNKIDIGVADAGFITIQFPAAIAGANFKQPLINGKFQGII